jgi:hypothetical protein
LPQDVASSDYVAASCRIMPQPTASLQFIKMPHHAASCVLGYFAFLPRQHAATSYALLA